MKKAFIFLLTIALLGLILTGCSTNTSPGDSGTSPPASSEEQTLTQSEKPKPIYGNQLKDGTYKIEVTSSSSMFRIIDAQITVAGGEISAVLTLSGDGYEKLYMGTGKEALADTDDKCIYFVENANGQYTYRVPVTALDQDTDCAAWSIRKKTWYDRVLVFQSSLIPRDAIIEV